MNKDYRVIDAMTRQPVIIAPSLTIQECAKTMCNKNVGSVIVMDDNNLVGVLTELDIVRKIVADGKNANTTLVKSLMSTQIHSINPGAKLYDAINLMVDLDIRHLPVLDGDEFMGFLTSKDILKIEPALFEIMIDSMKIREANNKPVYGSFNNYSGNAEFEADDDID